ncbi:MAG TPA: hypothetical protein VE198_20855 [Actinoallomurus sp.]|nr:hypothetical protein [Actinoallomurus sp.]
MPNPPGVAAGGTGDAGAGDAGVVEANAGVAAHAERSGGEGGEVGLISQGLADVLVHRLFAVGLDLHAALTYIEANISGDLTVDKIHKAIGGLDSAIKDFRGVVFDLHPEGAMGRDGLRALIVEAVERACAPGGVCPALTLGHGIDALIDEPAWQEAARLVHRALTLVPCERLAEAHVMVTADPRPPTRLVMHIDAPACDLSGVAGRLRALGGQGGNGHGMDISCRQARSPERSRIRVEWPVTSS